VKYRCAPGVWGRVGLLVLFLWNTASAVTLRKYDVFSGKILYKVYMEREVMGTIREINGTKRLVFDQNGFRELEEEHTSMQIHLMGREQTHKVHTMMLRNGTELKRVDFREKKIYYSRIPYTELMVRIMQHGAARFSDAMMDRAGGERVGSKVIAGYRCELWRFPEARICIYRGLPLEVERKLGGIVRHEEAIRAELDVSVSSEEYRLPDFPQVEVTGSRSPVIETVEGTGGYRRFSPEKSTGVREWLNDEAFFVSIRRKSLKKIASMQRLYNCLNRSDSLQEANTCGRRYASESGEPFEAGEVWNDAVKTMELQSLKKGLEVGNCLKAAQDLRELVECEAPAHSELPRATP